MNPKSAFLLSSVVACFFIAATPAASAQANPAAPASDTAVPAGLRVAYHVDDVGSLRNAMNNINNQLTATPNASISLVANGRGIFSLVGGERDRQGEFASAIAGLQARGVRFVACGMSMKKHNIAESSLIANVSTVPSGVVELTRLQGAERYAYIKP
ncbi:DsrE family protein [Variovorax sp. J2P1-59]|uniref:DsrE family protein n=1 Tax=Variovorax flavidus TaxID=3053501 RepID=UPI0025772042|nr:DsrE family protein [Variovorax sp. J2P1-59]MDM0077517.1 DsrE family protein [Variovorax sp. J2P1-59]